MVIQWSGGQADVYIKTHLLLNGVCYCYTQN